MKRTGHISDVYVVWDGYTEQLVHVFTSKRAARDMCARLTRLWSSGADKPDRDRYRVIALGRTALRAACQSMLEST